MGLFQQIPNSESSQRTRPIADRKLVMRQLMRKEALLAFKEWKEKADKIKY